jgi:hypothetical protein
MLEFYIVDQVFSRRHENWMNQRDHFDEHFCRIALDSIAKKGDEARRTLESESIDIVIALPRQPWSASFVKVADFHECNGG